MRVWAAHNYTSGSDIPNISEEVSIVTKVLGDPKPAELKKNIADVHADGRGNRRITIRELSENLQVNYG